MPRRRAVIQWTLGLGCMTCGVPVPARAQDAAPDVPAGHPLLDYQRAIALFGEGKRDEATCWFYRGQLRFRIHLAARPDLPQDGDPALFASLNEVAGRPVNEWAFGDVVGVAAILGRVARLARGERRRIHAEGAVPGRPHAGPGRAGKLPGQSPRKSRLDPFGTDQEWIAEPNLILQAAPKQTSVGLRTDEKLSRLVRPGTAAGHLCDRPHKPA